jgi:hypothetical protein
MLATGTVPVRNLIGVFKVTYRGFHSFDKSQL